MDRRLLVVAAVAVLLIVGVPAAQAADLKIVAGPRGVSFQTTRLQASAQRLSYDEAKGILILEGTADNPATLGLSRNGQYQVIRGAKILYSLKEDTFTGRP